VGGTLLGWDQYVTRWARLHGGVDPRDGTGFVRGWLRLTYRLGRLLARCRVPPAALTALGLVLCLLVPVVAAKHGTWPLAAAGLVLLAAVADSVDGAVAMIASKVTRLGYLYDSVADRVGEAAWLATFWLLGVPAWLVVLGGAVTWLHEYVRARATAAGMTEIGVATIAERPTRVIVVVVGLVLAGGAGVIGKDLAAGTLTIAAATWLVLAVIGIVQLLAAVQLLLARRRPPE
jgi:CDP-diacylglycerol--glycerol-3-phosphate 3-phosphatidyltransferase